MRRFLVECSLAAVNTFFEGGADWTWTRSRGHHSRIDHLLVLQSQLSYAANCQVNRAIELADAERDDHCVVQASFIVPAKDCICQHRPRDTLAAKPTLCKQKLKDGSLCEYFSNWMWTFTAKESDGIDEHLSKLKQHIVEGEKVFESDNRKPRKRWVSPNTWELLSCRSVAKKIMRNTFAGLCRARMSAVFLAWSACKPQSYAKHHSFAESLQACVVCKWTARAWAISSSEYHRYQINASKGVKQDKKCFLDALASKADYAAEKGDNTAIFRLVKRAAGFQSQELKVVQWEDGSLTTSPDQYAQRFQDHFCEVFGGEIVSSLNDSGVRQPQNVQCEQALGPSCDRTSRGIAKLKSGKAVGPDGISAEVINAGGEPFVTKFNELSNKIWRYILAPRLAWRWLARTS